MDTLEEGLNSLILNDARKLVSHTDINKPILLTNENKENSTKDIDTNKSPYNQDENNDSESSTEQFQESDCDYKYFNNTFNAETTRIYRKIIRISNSTISGRKNVHVIGDNNIIDNCENPAFTGENLTIKNCRGFIENIA